MSPRRNYRDPKEYYDVTYDAFPELPDVSEIINHPRKLVIVNLCANPYTAQVQEIRYERTCYEDEVEKTY